MKTRSLFILLCGLMCFSCSNEMANDVESGEPSKENVVMATDAYSELTKNLDVYNNRFRENQGIGTSRGRLRDWFVTVFACDATGAGVGGAIGGIPGAVVGGVISSIFGAAHVPYQAPGPCPLEPVLKTDAIEEKIESTNPFVITDSQHGIFGYQ